MTALGLPQSFRVPPASLAERTRPAELSIVVPTFNEADNVDLLVAGLEAALPGIAWEVIFVDDDSPDGTTARVRQLAAQDARVRCVRRIGRRGLSGAAIEGFLSSSAEVVALMDGDLQHDERLLPGMYRRIADGADLVVASRFAAGATAADGLSAPRLAGSSLATNVVRRLLGVEASDPLSGFFMIKRDTFETLAPRLSTQGFKLLLDILASAPKSLKLEEVPLSFRPRQHGTSKLDELVVLEFFNLLLVKLTADRVSPRFVMFALIGTIGVGVHLMGLRVALMAGLGFGIAQMVAAYVAMTGNFVLNNLLTYRDRRLKGWDAVTGLCSFYLACSVGMVANVGVGELIYRQDVGWWLAGIAGALMGAVFNYAATSAFTWRTR